MRRISKERAPRKAASTAGGSSSGRRLDRRFSTVGPSDPTEVEEETVGPNVSQAVKERIMNYKKIGAKQDPYSEGNREILQEFLRVVNRPLDPGASPTEAKRHLTEATLLLDYSVKVWCRQVDATALNVSKFASLCTRVERPNRDNITGQELLDQFMDRMGEPRRLLHKPAPESETEDRAVSDGARDSSSSAVEVVVSSEENQVEESSERTVHPPDEPDPEVHAEEVRENNPRGARIIECITIADDEDEQMVTGTTFETELAVMNSMVAATLVINPPELGVPDLDPRLEAENLHTSGRDQSTAPVERTEPLEEHHLEIEEVQMDHEPPQPDVHEVLMDHDYLSQDQRSENGSVETQTPVPNKRMRKDYGGPPELISCFDQGPAHEFNSPPHLDPEAKLRKQRNRMVPAISTTEEVTSPNDQSSPMGEGHDPLPLVDEWGESNVLPDGADALEGDMGNLELRSAEPTAALALDPVVPEGPQASWSGAQGAMSPQPEGASPEPCPSPRTRKIHALLEGVVIKLERIDDGYLRHALGVNDQSFEQAGSFQGATRGTFSPEDEAELLGYIQQLHSLPFTSELSKEQLTKTFEDAISRVENIYTEHNVPIRRHIVTAASNACAQISHAYGQWLTTDKNVIPAPPGLHELFSDKYSQETVSSQTRELTIMETTEEKTRAQSAAKMNVMIQELQRSIVPKYTSIPLIEENTKEFFHRVKTFENRVKRAIAEEEAKEEFDIRKYEKEVLDVTHSEEALEEPVIELIDIADEILVVPTPMTKLTMCGVGPEQPAETAVARFSFDGLPSPSTSSDGSSSGEGAARWISLKNIFAHMKTLGRPEAARMFYAVLTLLSCEDLDIKYENHFSSASAAIAKNSGHKAGRRFSRGIKIMTSQSVDVDTDDIYISALCDKSHTQTFRENELKRAERIPPRRAERAVFGPSLSFTLAEKQRLAARFFLGELSITVSPPNFRIQNGRKVDIGVDPLLWMIEPAQATKKVVTGGSLATPAPGPSTKDRKKMARCDLMEIGEPSQKDKKKRMASGGGHDEVPAPPPKKKKVSATVTMASTTEIED